MVLQVLGIAAIVIFTVFIGKTAKENGRNAILWALAAVGVGLGLQFVIPILVMIVIAVVLVATGTRPDQVEAAIGWWAFGLTFLFLALSVVGMFLILRHVFQLPEDPEPHDLPPPPTFGDDQQR
jgi:hypothetical protein